jgi:iron complex outermembrane recepter protein
MGQFNRFQLVSLLALGIAMPAFAQNAPAAGESGPQTAPATAPAANNRDRDLVVVTASKREESVQDIAVAVTAITSELRDQIGLTTVQDYTNFAPGLSYSTSNDRLGMRGVTRTSNNFGIRSGISNYVDGVYFSSAIPASREPIFVDRVEVVRGPQGTLYGRDSIGGALNVISKRPSNDFEGQVNLGVGNFGTQKVEARVSGPITDWLRYSVEGSRSAQNEGFFHDAAGGETEGGRTDGYFVEGQLEGEITERFDWWIRAASLQWDKKGAPGARTGVDSPYPYNTQFYGSTSDIAPNAWYGLGDPNRVQVGTQSTNPSITDRYAFNTDYTNDAYLSPTSELALEAIWHADNFDIKYLGGYVWYNYDLTQDHDGSPIKSFNSPSGKQIFSERTSDYTENRGWYSNEINFLSTWDGPFQVVAGLYQYQENYEQTVFVDQLQSPGGPIWDYGALNTWLTNAGPFTGAPAPANLVELPARTGHTAYSGTATDDSSLLFFTDNLAINNAYGAFVQTEWEFTDQLKLTAGLRYSKDISNTREYARIVNHYVIESALENPASGFVAAYSYLPAYAGLRALLGSNALSIINATVPAVVPARIDVTSVLGGVDPATGVAGYGIQNVDSAHPLGIYLDPTTGNRYRDMHATWQEVTGVLGLDWKPDRDTLIYGKYNRGYKPGGFGAAEVYGILSPTPYTDQEIVDAVEFGLKREWPALNLTTNAVAFYYDYKGYQVSNQIVPEPPADPTAVRANPYTAYVNMPKVETTGFELETIWRPTDNLRFLFNYGYTNPEIKESPALVHSLDPFALDPAAQPLGTPATNGLQGQSLKGNILPYSPKNKIAFNTTYTWNFEDGSKLDGSISYLWQDIAFSSIFNRSYTKIPSWDQTDARLTWTSSDGNIALIGFVRNLFDEIQYDSKGSGLREGTNRAVSPTECFSTPGTTAAFGAKPANSCYTTGETLRPPRMYGAELQFRF